MLVVESTAELRKRSKATTFYHPVANPNDRRHFWHSASHPFMDPATKQQIIVSAIDKVLWGSVALLIGWIAARSLERYKTRNSLIQATAARRLEIVQPHLTRLVELNERWVGVMNSVFQAFCALAGVDATTGVGPAFFILSPRLRRLVKDAVHARQAEVEEFLSVVSSAREELRAQRYWLGSRTANAIDRELRLFRNSLTTSQSLIHITARLEELQLPLKARLAKVFVSLIPMPSAFTSRADDTIEETIDRLTR